MVGLKCFEYISFVCEIGEKKVLLSSQKINCKIMCPFLILILFVVFVNGELEDLFEDEEVINKLNNSLIMFQVHL